MNKETKSEKEQIIAFLLLCLKNWYYFVVSMVICTAIAVVYLKVKTPVMKVAAKVALREDDSLFGGGISKSNSLMSAFGMASGGVNVQDETTKIASQGYVKKVIKNLDLNKVYKQAKFFGLNKEKLYDQSPIVLSVEPFMSDTTKIVQFKLKVNNNKTQIKIRYEKKTIGKYEILSFPATLETPVGKFTFSKSAYFDNYKTPFNLNILLTNYDYMAQFYRKILDADYDRKNSDFINLNIVDENVSFCRIFLNEVIHIYNKEWSDDKNEVSEKTVSFINKNLDEVRLKLYQIDKDIQLFKDKNSLTDLDADIEYAFTLNAGLQAKLIDSETQLKLVDIISDYINDDEKKYELIPFSLTALDQSIGGYNAKLMERKEYYRMSNIKTSTMSSLDEQIEMLRKNLLLSLQNIKKGVQITTADLKNKDKELNIRLGNVPVIEREYISLKREQEVQQTLYTFLLEKNYETEVKSVSLLPKLKVIDEPYALIKPFAPRLMMVALALLFFGGIFFPLGLIYGIPCLKKLRKKEN
jgi:uncharacterized protein involved in exopolysaccharide biosynthesis